MARIVPAQIGVDEAVGRFNHPAELQVFLNIVMSRVDYRITGELKKFADRFIERSNVPSEAPADFSVEKSIKLYQIAKLAD